MSKKQLFNIEFKQKFKYIYKNSNIYSNDYINILT